MHIFHVDNQFDETWTGKKYFAHRHECIWRLLQIFWEKWEMRLDLKMNLYHRPFFLQKRWDFHNNRSLWVISVWKILLADLFGKIIEDARTKRGQVTLGAAWEKWQKHDCVYTFTHMLSSSGSYTCFEQLFTMKLTQMVEIRTCSGIWH